MPELRANDSIESIQVALHGLSQVESSQAARAQGRGGKGRAQGGAQTDYPGPECNKNELADAPWLAAKYSCDKLWC